MNALLRRCVPFLSVAAGLAAQNGLNESRGPLSGAAVAVALDNPTSATDAQARVHRNGFASGPLGAILPGGPPDLAAILAAHQAPAGLDVDDISLGRDDVLFDGAGLSDVDASSWAVLSFSLRNGATGLPGSRIAQEASLGPVGASLFSLVHEGLPLPGEEVFEVERSHSRQELGVSIASADVDAIDFPTVFGINQQTLGGVDPQFGALDPAPHRVYFTVSHATRGIVPAAWWGPGVLSQLRSGATIFVVTRQTPTAPWSAPAVWKHYHELGLGQDEDIDGLAVDRLRSRVLFSCTGTLRDQFLVLNGISLVGPVPVPARTATGTPISQVVQVAQNDDVDAVCTLDPRVLSSGPPPAGDDFGNSCGTPRAGLLGVPSVHASAARRYVGGLNRFFDTWMVGWPPVTGQGAGGAALFVTIGNDPTLLPATFLLRNPTSSVPGDPLQWSLGIPPTFALQGLELTFRWVAVDAAWSELAEARPVMVRL